MTELTRKALASLPLSAEIVESFYDSSRSGTGNTVQCLKALCVSHERLRAELEGAEQLLSEEPGKAAVRSLLTACMEAIAWLRRLNDFEPVSRALITTKDGQDDLATVGSNVLRHLDNAADAVRASLTPVKPGQADFETWLEETFCGRDHDLKMEAVPHAHVFDYDQTIRLATWIYSCMELKPPPWWSKYADADKLHARLAHALALTDTGSAEFKAAFPPRSRFEETFACEMVPGWHVVSKIREVLLGDA